jgi:hypothetical protein
MKNTKKIFFLGLAILFLVDFIFSIFNTQTQHEFFLWEIDIIYYQFYRFSLFFIFAALYLKQQFKLK